MGAQKIEKSDYFTATKNKTKLNLKIEVKRNGFVCIDDDIKHMEATCILSQYRRKIDTLAELRDILIDELMTGKTSMEDGD